MLVKNIYNLIYFTLQGAWYNKTTSNHIQQVLNSKRIRNGARLRAQTVSKASTASTSTSPASTSSSTCKCSAESAEGFLSEVVQISVSK